MVVESARNRILCDDNTVKVQLECYIEKDEDLDEIAECAPSSKALNVTNGDIWVLMDDLNWQKFGTNVKVEAAFI